MAKWINRTVDQEARNGTTTHSLTFTAATAGNLLVAVVEGSVTHTAPAGWTKQISALNNTELAVFTKVSLGGETTFTTVHNGSNYPVVGVFYEFPAGSTYLSANDVSSTGVALSGANPNMTGLTGTNLTFGAVGFGYGDVNPAGSSAVWTGTGSPVEDVDVFAVQATTDGYGLSIAYVEDNTASSFQPTATVTTAGAVSTKECVTFAVKVQDPTQSYTDTILYRNIGAIASSTAAGTTLSVAYPSGIQVGDLLLITSHVNGNILPTAPGFSQAGDSGTTATNNRTTILMRVADGSESGSVTVTYNGTNNRKAYMTAWQGVDPTTPLDGTPTTRSSTSGTNPYTAASQTPTMVGTMPVWAVTVNNATATWTSPTTATELHDSITQKSGAFYKDVDPLTSTAATGTRGGTASTTGANSTVYLLLRPNVVSPGGETHSGTLDLTGSRTLDLAGSPGIAATQGLSGSRSLSVPGSPNVSATQALTGSRTLGLVSAPSVPGTLGLSGTGALTLNGSPSWTGTLGLSGTGSTTPGTAVPAIPSALTLTGSRTLGLAGAVSTSATLSITGGRTLDLSGTIAITDTLVLSRTGSLIPSGSPTIPGTLGLSGTGATSGYVGVPTYIGTLALSGTGSLNLSGVPNFSASLGMSGSGGVAGQGTPAPTATVSLIGTRTLGLSGAAAIGSVLTLTGSRLLELAGSAAGAGDLLLTGSRSLGFIGLPSIPGTLNLSASRVLNVAGSPAMPGTMALSASRSISLAGVPSISETLALSGAGSGAYDGAPAIAGELDLDRTGSLQLSGVPSVGGALGLEGSTNLQLAGSSDGSATLNLTGSRTLSMSGTASIPATMTLLGLPDLDLTGSPSTSDSIALSGSRTLGLSGNIAASGSLGLSGSGTTGPAGNPAIPGTTTLSGEGLLTLIATALSTYGTLALTGSRVLLLAGTGFAEGQGSLNLFGSRTLGFSGTPSIAGTLGRTGTGTLEMEGEQANGGTLLLEGSRTLTLTGAPAVAGELALTLAGELTFDGAVLVNGSLLLTGSRTIVLSGNVVGTDPGGIFLKDGTELHAFMLVGGILKPVTPIFGES